VGRTIEKGIKMSYYAKSTSSLRFSQPCDFSIIWEEHAWDVATLPMQCTIAHCRIWRRIKFKQSLNKIILLSMSFLFHSDYFSYVLQHFKFCNPNCVKMFNKTLHKPFIFRILKFEIGHARSLGAEERKSRSKIALHQ